MMQSTAVRQPIPGVVYPDEASLVRWVEAGVLTRETLVSALAEVVRRHPDRIAISEPGALCTHRELDERTDLAAAGLLQLGLAPLDRVIFQVSNSKELIFGLLACLKAGLIPICTLTAFRRHEIGTIGRMAGARAHLVHGDDPKFDFVGFALEMQAELPSLEHVIVTRGKAGDADRGAVSFESLSQGIDLAAARERLAQIERDPFQVAIFQLSGGTSGVPKIIPRFHNEYLYAIRSVIRRHGLDHTVVAFTPNPLLHNAPMVTYWGPALFAGGEVVISPGLDAGVIAGLIEARRPDWGSIPLVILLRLNEAGLLSPGALAHARGLLVSNSARRVSGLTGAPAWPQYGMTEGLISCVSRGDPEEAIERSVGRPMSDFDEVRIMRLDGSGECDIGEVGELWTRGPCTIRGYFDAEETNRTAFSEDGFYRSGDLMSWELIGGERYLAFHGRLKDVVSRGGEKINCSEVEQAAIRHPAIGAIAVVPMPDPAYGERACAFVIPTPGADPVTVTGLGRFLETLGMAKFKWPERIEIVDSFPMTNSGKLSKPRLREIIAGKLAGEAGQ
jgi:non-ribosomal peptide synthetase component E (peptide arylation enzyme)